MGEAPRPPHRGRTDDNKKHKQKHDRPQNLPSYRDPSAARRSPGGGAFDGGRVFGREGRDKEQVAVTRPGRAGGTQSVRCGGVESPW